MTTTVLIVMGVVFNLTGTYGLLAQRAVVRDKTLCNLMENKMNRREMLAAAGSMVGVSALPGAAKASDQPMPILDFIRTTTIRLQTAIPGKEGWLDNDTIQLNVCMILCHATSYARNHYDLEVNYLPGWEEWVWGGVLGLCQMQVARILGARTHWQEHPKPSVEEYVGYKESSGFWTADDPLLKTGLDNWNGFWKDISEANSQRCRESNAKNLKECVQKRKAAILSHKRRLNHEQA